jgi:hypothetical protein
LGHSTPPSLGQFHRWWRLDLTLADFEILSAFGNRSGLRYLGLPGLRRCGFDHNQIKTDKIDVFRQAVESQKENPFREGGDHTAPRKSSPICPNSQV